MAEQQSTDASSKQKRARSQLSCAPCRQGKLKCDRAHPACDQCIKRSRDEACVYLPPAVRNREGKNVKGRIRHLEQLVVELMHSKNNTDNNPRTSPPSKDSTDPDSDGIDSSHTARRLSTDLTPPSSGEEAGFHYERQDAHSDLGAFGQLKISKSETSYVGQGHWASILDSISDLKREVDDGEDDSAEFDEWQQEDSLPANLANTSNSSSLLNSPKRMTKTEILASIPPKHIVDQLVSAFWNSPDPFKPILHAIQFQQEYHRHFQEPRKTPVMWLALLFSIMSLGCSMRLKSGSIHLSPSAQATIEEAQRYHEIAASAAILADYSSCKNHYTIETLILYAGGLRSACAFFDVWLLTGVILRLAIRMGYHRDGDHYKISPYTAEMRRRQWGCLYMADVLMSWQLGLPGLVRAITSDTKPPHNLLDHDFGPHTKVLPLSRPVEEFTPCSYGAVKVQICRVFADAADLSNATTPPSYSEVTELDDRLQSARSNVPTLLRLTETSVTLTPEHLMCSYNLELLYLKSRIIIHRRYMTQQGQEHSRSVCIRSAMDILGHHQAIYSASQPGGRLEVVAWYMGSIGTYDFLLAAMIICLELSQHCTPDVLPNSDGTQDPAMRQEMIQALERSKCICEETRKHFLGDTIGPALSAGTWNEIGARSEITTAIRAMSVMLDKVKARYPQPGVEPVVTADISQAQTSLHPPLPASAGFPMVDYSQQSDLPEAADLNDFLMIDSMLDDNNNINWGAWDQQLSLEQNQGSVPEWNIDDFIANSVGTTDPTSSFWQSL